MKYPLLKQQAIERINQLSAAGVPFIFIINYNQECSFVEEVAAVDASLVLYDFNGFTNSKQSAPLNKEISWQSSPLSFSQYKQSFDCVLRNIQMGNSFLTNLTCITPIRTNLSLQEIYVHSKALYKLWVKNEFVMFSPEIFVRIQGNRISSYPMKGTINATLPHAQNTLLNDPKEAAEHATIVDLIRNDLSMVASNVSVGRYRYVDVLQTYSGPILQTSSEINGILPDKYHLHLGDILFSLLPAGSITGAPKQKTMEIISEAEQYDRGFYTGITGYFDGKNIDSAVIIRFIEQKGEQLYFKSGGGITCKSDLESEYNEMKQKVYVPIY